MNNIYEETLAAANAGNPHAQHDLGMMYGKGIHVVQDISESIEWFGKAACQGLPEAVEIYCTFAEEGVMIAQCNLAAMYANGQGVDQNYKEAARWYAAAANQGNIEAKARLAMMYYMGQGVHQSYDQAMELARPAAESGNVRAQFILGSLYALGQAAATDYRQSYYWLSKAIIGSSDTETSIRDRALTSINAVAKAISRETIEEVVRELQGEGILIVKPMP